jgi:hypothetical protein
MHLQFLIAVKEAIEFSLMAFGGITLVVLFCVGLVKFWIYCLRLPVEPEPAVAGQEPSATSQPPFAPGQWCKVIRKMEWLYGPSVDVPIGAVIQLIDRFETLPDAAAILSLLGAHR